MIPVFAVVFVGILFSPMCLIGAPLTLTDAVTTALGGNSSLKQAENDRLNSLSSLKVAGFTTTYGVSSFTNLKSTPREEGTDGRVSGMAGQLFGNLTYQGFSGTTVMLNVAPLGVGSEQGSLALTLRQPLASGKGHLSEKSDRLLSAQSELDIQNKGLYIVRQSTVAGVVDAYCRALLAREQVKVQERAVSISEDAATRARKLAEAGKVAEIEVTRAEIRVAQTRDQLNLQRQEARASVDKLMLAMGSGVGDSPDLSEKVPDPQIDVPPLAEAVQTALDQRPELAVMDERKITLERKLAIARDSLRPKLDVVAGFNSTARDSTVISQSILDLGSLNAGLELKFPLDRRISMEDKQSADRSVRLLGTLRDYEMETIAEQVREAYRRYESAQSSVGIYGQNLKVTEDNLRLAQRMLEEGLDDNRNVLEAQQELTRVQGQLLSTKVDLFLAKVNLRRAIGDDLTKMGWK